LQIKAQELFVAYDADHSSFIDLNEFTTLCKAYDDSIDSDGVAQTFQMVNATDGRIDLAAFFRWVQMMFGECDNAEFQEGMRDMLSAATKVAASPAKGVNTHGLSKNCVQWADKLFDLYDSDRSGTMSVHEFYALMRKYDPSMTEPSVHATFEACGAKGGQITQEQFYAWCAMIFGTDDGDCEDGLRELIQSSGSMVNLQMTPARRATADQIWNRFDPDKSGRMTLSDFAALYILIDSMCTMEVIQKQFETAGCMDEMAKDGFERWIGIQFKEQDDPTFAKTAHTLLSGAAQLQRAPSPSPQRGSPAGLPPKPPMSPFVANAASGGTGEDASMKERLRSLQSEISRHEETRHQLAQQSAQEQQRLSSLQQQRQQEMVDSAQFKERSEKERAALDARVNQSKIEAEQAQKFTDAKKAEAARAEAELIPLTQRKMEVQQSVSKQQTEVQAMESRLRQLNNDVESANFKYTDAQSKVMNSARHIEGAQEQVTEMETRLRQLNSDVATRSLRAEEITRELHALEAQKVQRLSEENLQKGERTARESSLNTQIGDLSKAQQEANESLHRQQAQLIDAEAKLASLQSTTSEHERAAAVAEQKRLIAETLLHREEEKLAAVEAETEAKIKAVRDEAERKARMERERVEAEAQVLLVAITKKAKADQEELLSKSSSEVQGAMREAQEIRNKSQEQVAQERLAEQEKANHETDMLRLELQRKVEEEKLVVQRELEITKAELQVKQQEERKKLEEGVSRELQELERKMASIQETTEAELAKQKEALKSKAEAEELLAQQEHDKRMELIKERMAKEKAVMDDQSKLIEQENERRQSTLRQQATLLTIQEEEHKVATTKLQSDFDVATASMVHARKQHEDEHAKQEAKRLQVAKQVAELEAKAKILKSDVEIGTSSSVIGDKIKKFQADALALSQNDIVNLGGKLDLLAAEVKESQVSMYSAMLESESLRILVPDMQAELDKAIAQQRAVDQQLVVSRGREQEAWESTKKQQDVLLEEEVLKMNEVKKELTKVSQELNEKRQALDTGLQGEYDEKVAVQNKQMEELREAVEELEMKEAEMLAAKSTAKLDLEALQTRVHTTKEELVQLEEAKEEGLRVMRDAHEQKKKDLDAELEIHLVRAKEAAEATEKAEASAKESQAMAAAASDTAKAAEKRAGLAETSELNNAGKSAELLDALAKRQDQLAALQAEQEAIESKRKRDIEEDRQRAVQMEEDAKALQMAKQAGDDQSRLQVIQAQAEVAREREKREKADANEGESRNGLIEANLKLKEATRGQELLQSQLEVAKMLAEEANEKVAKLTAKFNALEASSRSTEAAEAEAKSGMRKEVAVLEERLRGLHDTERATRVENEALTSQRVSLSGEVSRLEGRCRELREEMERSTKHAMQAEESAATQRRRKAEDLESRIEGRKMQLAELEATKPLASPSPAAAAAAVAKPSPAVARLLAETRPAPATPDTPNQTFYTPPTEDKNSPGLTASIAAASAAVTPELGRSTAEASEASLSPIERRKSRLLALRKRLADQYGSPNSATAATTTPPPTVARTPGSGKDGEKSFDDLVNVCIRLREELDEQRSALLAEFSTSTPPASPEKQQAKAT